MTQMTVADRAKIESMLEFNFTLSKIAKKLSRHRSTIFRELKRHPTGIYSSWANQIDYESRKKNCGRKRLLDKLNLRSLVVDKLEKGWSPQQISGRLKLEKLFISHEAIYQFIYNDKYCKENKIYQYLRQGKRKRTKRYGRRTKGSKIINRISIEKRPKYIDQRIEFGHWEGDSIVSAGRKSFLNTLVERKTRYLVASILKDHTSSETSKAISLSLECFKPKIITFDNGLEFAKHEYIAKELSTNIYFCHPYSSFERGTNENTNGLIRRYLPKRKSFSGLTQDDLNDIVWELNNRPRKCLGYKTPTEALQSECTLTVAINLRI